jgi:uncharacterized membrane protein YfcA
MSNELAEFLRLAPIGFLVGAFGTLVGAGGGAILVHVLLVMMPDENPATITAISLAVVFFNAYSGTITYMRMGRVDYRLGTLFTLSGLPAAVAGVVLVHEMPRRLFDPLFGVLLVGIGVFLLLDPTGKAQTNARLPARPPSRGLLGSVGSAYIALLSSLVGIGGGIIHVPFLIRVLKIPPHTATATSHFVLTFVAFIACATHVLMGEFQNGLPEGTYLAVGVMMGAPIGASLSTRIRGAAIVRLLAASLCLVGLRLLFRVL